VVQSVDLAAYKTLNYRDGIRTELEPEQNRTQQRRFFDF